MAVGPGYIVGNDALKGDGYSNGSELGDIHSILVETEQVRIGEVWLHACINTHIENASE